MTKIAICQLNPIYNDPRKNIDTIEKTIFKYSKKNIKLFIFPEDYLHGVLRGEKIYEASKEYERHVKSICILAKKYNVDILPGSLPSKEGERIYNTSLYINSNGDILNTYHKTNLWLAEREDYSINPKKPKAFESILGRTMLIICWDILDHELFKEAIRQDVKWIINSSLWSLDQSKSLAEKRGYPSIKYNLILRKAERLDSLIEARSQEYNMGMIFCNIGGNHKMLENDGSQEIRRSAGCSQIIAPLDGIRKSVRNRHEQVLICEVPEIENNFKDHEIFYNRRDDIKSGYPYLNKE